MMKKLYTIYDNNKFVVNCAEFKESEQPVNSTDLLCTENFVKAKFENGIFFEGANQEEIETYQKNLVPYEITKRQFGLALFILKGISYDDLIVFAETLEEPNKTLALINIKTTSSYKYDNEMLNQFAPAMNLTQDDLDQIFILGNTIE